MNSTNKLVEKLKGHFTLLSYDFPMDLQIGIDVDKDDVHGLLSYLKADGFRQLSLISGIDWIKDNKFELVFIVMNWETGIHVQVRTMLDRDKPIFRTITEIYPGAQYYERDVQEFFGIEFEGNQMASKHLFLELWDDMPPMRKDFDPRAYKAKKSPEREYERKFKPIIGGAE